jgi:hypothetical protein
MSPSRLAEDGSGVVVLRDSIYVESYSEPDQPERYADSAGSPPLVAKTISGRLFSTIHPPNLINVNYGANTSRLSQEILHYINKFK